MIDSGEDLSQQRPHQTDEDQWSVAYNPYDDEATIGHHRGHFESLNIRNAQAGMHYVYVHNSDGAILSRLNRGYELVTQEHPERYGADRLPEGYGSGRNGGVRAFGDVVLMRIPVEEHNRQRDEHRAQNADRLEGVTTELLEGGEHHARHLRNFNGQSVYYRRPSHGTNTEDLDHGSS